MAGLTEWQEECMAFETEIEGVTDKQQRRNLIVNHLERCAKLNVRVPEFDKGLEWINTERGLSLHRDLTGGLVILDFFTYCCINCIHVLPDLEALEQAFPPEQGVAVVGVHSAKFANEKISANILSAVLRYGINHAVVNDSDAKLWNELSIQCWPTLTVVSPKGQLVYSFVGEGHRDKLLEFVSVGLDFYRSKGEITLKGLPLKPAKDNLPDSPLSFPGKVCCSDDGKVVVVADTGHHRILVLGSDGIVKHTVGGRLAGFKDGSFEEASFNSPQGVCYHDDVVFVADTENHSIRKVDLKTRTVLTVAGTGQMGEDKQGGQLSVDQAISSPWDVLIGSSIGSGEKDLLWIAMAGSHQIWGLFLKHGKWLKGREYKAGTCIRLAGSGNEENRNNSYPEKAAFAQPSGLALSTHGDQPLVFVADAESSSIRTMSLKDGAVKALVGGERDPKNLFAYGDVDGKGYEARLQHPLGVAVLSEDPCVLAVADSYNHKIKKVDVGTKQCTSYVGSGKAGSTTCEALEGASLNEPGGLCVDRSRGLLYIADTNNHAIKTVDIQAEVVRTFPIIFPEEVPEEPKKATVFKRLTNKSTPVTDSTAVRVSPEGKLIIRVQVDWAEGVHLTEGVTSHWQLWLEGTPSTNPKHSVLEKGKITDRLAKIPDLVISLADAGLQTEAADVYFEAICYVCDDAGVCKMKAFLHRLPVRVEKGGHDRAEVSIKLLLS